jgi:hypothetical protein
MTVEARKYQQSFKGNIVVNIASCGWTIKVHLSEPLGNFYKLNIFLHDFNSSKAAEHQIKACKIQLTYGRVVQGSVVNDVN